MILFYILIFSLPLSQHWLFGAGFGDFTVVKFLALACLPFALLRLFARLRSGRLSVPELWVPLLVYSVIALFSYFCGAASWFRHIAGGEEYQYH